MVGTRKAWLFTNPSPPEIYSLYSSIDAAHDLIIAVDNGLARLHLLNLTPHILIGDFDSLDPQLLDLYPNVTKLKFPTHKDSTDTELALEWCTNEGVRELVICNDLGGRFDHALALVQNLSALVDVGVSACIESQTQQVVFLTAHTAILGKEGYLLTLLAWEGEAEFLDSTGLEYPLQGLKLSPGHPRGISNRIISSEASIQVVSGKVLAVFTKIN